MLIDYTIGQRKGLGLSHPTPLYVIEIKAKEKIVIVGPYSALEKYKIYLNKLNIVDEIDVNKIYTTKLRSTGVLLDCYIRFVDENNKEFVTENYCLIELITPDFGIAPGQVCIIYEGERVIMSGTIYKKDL